RPAHGLHTPVLAVAGERRNMRLVTWDVRADDRRTDDAATLAHRVLDDIRPGSIVAFNLYRARDSDDRDVSLAALPLVLNGLRQRGLEPVRLDQLLNAPAYAGSC